MKELKSKNADHFNKFFADLTYSIYYNKFRLLALSMFEWVNLPKSCDARFLEKCLYSFGKAIFIYDKNFGFMNLKCTTNGTLNDYELPVSYQAFSIRYNKSYQADDCVIIRNNLLELCSDDIVSVYAKRICDIQNTCDVNLVSQKFPFIITCNEKQRLTMQILFEKFKGNTPFIFGDKDTLDMTGVNVITTNTQFNLDKLHDYKKDMENEFMTFMGFNNANTDKKERLITDEVNANNESVEMFAESMLLTRKKACEEINEKYGLNIDVKRRETKCVEKEAENNGELHDND